MIEQFSLGDIVYPVTVGTNFTGVVIEVNPAINKVMVAWGGGSEKQHDPDEIQLHPFVSEEIKEKMACVKTARLKAADCGCAPEGSPWYDEEDGIAVSGSRVARRMRGSDELVIPPDFQGDPETHGIDEPRGGGFSIMKDLAQDLHKESINAAEEPLRSRRAMYWCAPGRTYRLTRGEQNGGDATCPKCGGTMSVEPYQRKEKMFRCPGCGFKVSTGKVVKQKIEIEVDTDGSVEVDVTTAGRRASR
jgi:predicted RNA-binding Zn-ribbon protein involved in translation (DUF1610 family)